MAEAVTPWLHLLAAMVWVGPQLFLFLAAVPALRAIDDEAARRRATVVMTRRFNMMAWSAMAILIVTGIGNVFDRGEQFAFDYDFRYAWILTAKLALVALTISLTVWHSFVIGPRVVAAQAVRGADDAFVRALRRRSVMVSAVNLLATLAIVFLAALLQQTFAFQPV